MSELELRILYADIIAHVADNSEWVPMPQVQYVMVSGSRRIAAAQAILNAESEEDLNEALGLPMTNENISDDDDIAAVETWLDDPANAHLFVQRPKPRYKRLFRARNNRIEFSIN